MNRNTQAFDVEHADALKDIWLLGDVHGDFKHIAQCILDAQLKPRWLVFLGDIDIDHKPFRELCVQPLKRSFPAIQVAFIRHTMQTPMSTGTCSTIAVMQSPCMVKLLTSMA